MESDWNCCTLVIEKEIGQAGQRQEGEVVVREFDEQSQVT